jgi:hypothetical protein
MRDIRSDLQERADHIERQISAAGTDFEETLQQLQRKLKAELTAISIVTLAEHYRIFLRDLVR